MTTDIIPAHQGPVSISSEDIPDIIAQTNQVHSEATRLRAKKIVFDNGATYQDNGNSYTMAGFGGVVTVTQKTTTVTIANDGIDLKDALTDVVTTHTQEIAASFAGTSQSSVSVQLNSPKDDI